MKIDSGFVGAAGGPSVRGVGRTMSVLEANARLGKFATALNGKSLQLALMAGGLQIQNRWKELVRERFFETGTYMRSIHMEPGDVGPASAEVMLGTDIVDDPYPFYGEFGTSRMPARPTARPAMDERGDAAFDDFVEALDRVAATALL